MSDQTPYTPDLAYVRDSYIHGAADWEEDSIKAADFDRFIAKVKRDAARVALDSLLAKYDRLAPPPGAEFSTEQFNEKVHALRIVAHRQRYIDPEDVTP